MLSPLLFLPDFPFPAHIHPHTPSSLPSCCHLLFQKLPHIVPPPPPWRGSCIRVHASGSWALCMRVPVCLARVEHASLACVWLCHMHVCVTCWSAAVCVCVLCVCVDCLHKCIMTHGLSPTLEVVAPGGPVPRLHSSPPSSPEHHPFPMPGLHHERSGKNSHERSGKNSFQKPFCLPSPTSRRLTSDDPQMSLFTSKKPQTGHK